jgi:DNA invertase Pin-like site-specific DNA recombinase
MDVEAFDELYRKMKSEGYGSDRASSGRVLDDVVFDPYLRKSTKDQYRSVERQVAEMVDNAPAQGVQLADHVFVDPDLSASRFKRKERPDFDALVARVRAGRSRGIAIAEASRGSRSLTEWSGFLDLCRKHGVLIWVVSHRRVYDLAYRQDWRVLADEGVNAADESERLAERILSGKRKAARAGRPAGPSQFGFLRIYSERGELTQVVQHPVQAPLVVEMVKRVAAGEARGAIAADFNQRGIATPRGGRAWTGLTVRAIVLNPALVGDRVHNGEVVGAAIWPALVERAVWLKACKTIQAATASRTATRGSALASWLSGAVLCGACRQTTLRPVKQRYTCRDCHGVMIAKAPLENLIEQLIKGRLRLADAAAVFAKGVDSAELAAAERELAELQATMDEHYQQAALRRLSATGLTRMEELLKPQIARAEVKVKALRTPSDLSDLGGPEQILHDWPDMAATNRRRVVRALVDLVVSPALRKGGPGLDPRRLDESRWSGDELTWGQRFDATTALTAA